MTASRGVAIILVFAAAGATASCSDATSPRPLPPQEVGPGVFIVESRNGASVPVTEPPPLEGCGPASNVGGFLFFSADSTVHGEPELSFYRCDAELSGSGSLDIGRYAVNGSALVVETRSSGRYSGTLSDGGLRASSSMELLRQGARLGLVREDDAAEAVRRVVALQRVIADKPSAPGQGAVFFLESVNGAELPYALGSSQWGTLSVTGGYLLLTGAGQAHWVLYMAGDSGMTTESRLDGAYTSSGKTYTLSGYYGQAVGLLDALAPANASVATFDIAASSWYWLELNGGKSSARFRFGRERDATAAMERLWRLWFPTFPWAIET